MVPRWFPGGSQAAVITCNLGCPGLHNGREPSPAGAPQLASGKQIISVLLIFFCSRRCVWEPRAIAGPGHGMIQIVKGLVDQLWDALGSYGALWETPGSSAALRPPGTPTWVDIWVTKGYGTYLNFSGVSHSY